MVDGPGRTGALQTQAGSVEDVLPAIEMVGFQDDLLPGVIERQVELLEDAEADTGGHLAVGIEAGMLQRDPGDGVMDLRERAAIRAVEANGAGTLARPDARRRADGYAPMWQVGMVAADETGSPCERRDWQQRAAIAGVDGEEAGDPVDRAFDLGVVVLEAERDDRPVAAVGECVRPGQGHDLAVEIEADDEPLKDLQPDQCLIGLVRIEGEAAERQAVHGG